MTRRVGAEEAAALSALGARLFEETYRDLTEPADLAAHVAALYHPDVQRADLLDPDVITFFVDADGEAVGYVQVRRARPPADVDHEAAVELRWFYLDSAWHGRGVATGMMAAARGAAHELGEGGMWLSVWKQNSRAIAFYRKCGFAEVGTSEFRVGADRQTDVIMAVGVEDAE